MSVRKDEAERLFKVRAKRTPTSPPSLVLLGSKAEFITLLHTRMPPNRSSRSSS